MDFTRFTENIVELLRYKMGDDYVVSDTKIRKNNDVMLTAVTIMDKTSSISPTIYLEGLYEQYRAGATLEELTEKIMEFNERHVYHGNLDINFFRNYALVKERIYHKLINYEKNQELLKDVPHFRWHDLAVVFYYAMEEKTFGKASILIHNNHLDMWGQRADEVYRTACSNMKKHMRELLMPMQEVLEMVTGVQAEENGNWLYVLSNKEKVFGASVMLYSEKIKELADELQSDLLILPSSVHEGATRFAA